MTFVGKKTKIVLIIFLLQIILLDFIGGRVLTFVYKRLDKVSEQTYSDLRKNRVKDPVYHHGLVPNADFMDQWGIIKYPVRTNSLGFKDATVRDVPLKTDQHRVVFIGDSFTEGTGVVFEETFVGRIHKELSEKNIDVLNAAVQTYSPAIYYAKIKYLLETVGLEFDELVLFLDISDIYDDALEYKLDPATGKVTDAISAEVKEAREQEEQQAGWSVEKFKRNVKRWAKESSMTLRIISVVKNRFNKEDIKRNRIGAPKCRWTLDAEEYAKYGDLGLKNAEEHLDMLAALLKEHHVKLSVAIYPWPYQIYHRDLNSLQVQHWRQWSIKSKTLLVNFFPYFIHDESWEKVLEEYFIPGDLHWNSRGHALVAEKFLEHWEPAIPERAYAARP